MAKLLYIASGKMVISGVVQSLHRWILYRDRECTKPLACSTDGFPTASEAIKAGKRELGKIAGVVEDAFVGSKLGLFNIPEYPDKPKES